MNYKIKYIKTKKQYLLKGGSNTISQILEAPLTLQVPEAPQALQVSQVSQAPQVSQVPQALQALQALPLLTLTPLSLERNIYSSQKNIKIIKSHGVIIGTTFIIPENTYIITINDCGTPIPVSEFLDEKLRLLIQIINTEPIFQNNNESNTKTEKLIQFENYINDIFKDRFQSYFSNHLPGSEMSDMILNFIADPCDKISCGIEFFNPITNNISIIEVSDILDNLKDKEPKQQFGSPREIIDEVQGNHFRDLILTNARQQIDINKLEQEIKENESNLEYKLELLEQIKLLHKQTSERIAKYKDNRAIDRVINLDDGCVFLQTLIREYGTGIYIIRACRRFNELISEKTTQLLRQKSFDNRK